MQNIEQKFSKKLEKILQKKTPPKMAVGLSGGADSKTLLLLLQNWLKENANNCEFTAIIIDHNIRLESKIEAYNTGLWCKKNNINYVILKWEKGKGEKISMNHARIARFNLFQNWCEINNCDTLFLGHNANDQIETIMINLLRGSGLKGLCGISEDTYLTDENNFDYNLQNTNEQNSHFNPLMHKVNTRNHSENKQDVKKSLRIIRPMLEITRSEIENYLKNLGENWIFDPSNNDDKYLRARVRKFLNYELNIDRRNLWEIAENLKADYEIIQEKITDFLKEVKWENDKAIIMKGVILNEHKAIVTRGFEKLLKIISGKKSIRYENIEQVYNNVLNSKSCTLAGCMIRVSDKRVKISLIKLI